MRTYWVLDKNNNDAPLALVEGNGRLQVVDIIRFGPALVELDAQQQVWDSLIGRLLPTLKPFVASDKINEAGVEPHPKLWRGSGSAQKSSRPHSGAAGPQGRSGGASTPRMTQGDR